MANEFEIKTWQQEQYTSSINDCNKEITKITKEALNSLNQLAETARKNKSLSNSHLTIVLNSIEETKNVILNKHERS